MSSEKNTSKPVLVSKDTLLSHMGDDPEILQEIVKEFIDSAQSMLNEIKSAMENRDIQAFTMASHSFKGAVSNFFVDPVTEKAFTLEKMGKSGNLDGAEHVFSSLQNDVDILIQQLDSLVKNI